MTIALQAMPERISPQVKKIHLEGQRKSPCEGESNQEGEGGEGRGIKVRGQEGIVIIICVEEGRWDNE